MFHTRLGNQILQTFFRCEARELEQMKKTIPLSLIAFIFFALAPKALIIRELWCQDKPIDIYI